MKRRTALRGATVAAVFVAATIVMLRPAPAKISQSMPQNLGDSVLITWIMHWGFRALTTDPLHYFNGNVFWPAGNTLAYSDLLLPFVPVYGLFFTVTGNWPLSTNLTVLTMVGLCLVSTYLLARRLVGSPAASVVAALAFTFTGFHLSEWGHIQLNTLGLLSLAAYFVVRFLDERRWWTAVAAGVATASTMLAAVYYGVLWFLAVGLILGGYVVAKRFRPGPRFVRGAAVLGLVTLVLTGPALLRYAQQGERRGYEDYRGLKARDLVTPAVNSYVWKDYFTYDGYPALQEHGLYPGFTVVGLGAVGIVSLVRRRRQRDVGGVGSDGGDSADGATEQTPALADPGRPLSPDATLHLTLLGVAGLVGLVLAIGPTALGIPMPFRIAYALIPGFSGLRVYTRLAILFLLALALTAGVGTRYLLRFARRRHPMLAPAALVAVIGLVLLDLSAPLAYAPFPDSEQTLAVYRALEGRPRGAVVEIPMVDAGILPAEWAYVEAPRMVYSTIGFRPRVNGYSAKAPPTYKADLDTFNAFPTPQSIQRAYELRVRFVIIHVGAQTDYATYSEADAQARVDALPDTATAERYGDSWLVDLGPVRPPDRG